MKRYFLPIGFLLCGLIMLWTAGSKADVEIFAKGAVSKNYLDVDKHTTSVSASAGIAVMVFPRMRIEARFTNLSSLQNRLDVVGTSFVLGTMTDIKTETSIYSLGIDLDILGKRSVFQPFIFVGAGYILSKRSYYFTQTGASDSNYYQEPLKASISGNLGLGFRLLLSNSFAFEIEIFAYGLDIDKPDEALVNLYGTVGVRLFL